jgi:hypothetical protein
LSEFFVFSSHNYEYEGLYINQSVIPFLAKSIGAGTGAADCCIALFLFMFGYMIWDRRTAMKPALEQASKAIEDNRKCC